MLNKNRDFIVFILVSFIFLFSFSGVYAVESLGAFKQYDNVRLVQTCSLCTYVTLDSVKLPNSTLLFINTNMTSSGSTYYYDFNNTDLPGDYIYNTAYGNYSSPVSFTINRYGDDLSSGKSGIYFIFIVTVTLLFILCLWGTIKIPFYNNTDDRGKVLSINNLKYVKIFLGVMCYVMVLMFIGLTRSIINNYLYASSISNGMDWIFNIMLIGLYVAVPCTFVWMIMIFFEDKKINEFIERGFYD